MKKLLTLAVVSLFTMAAMAADHYPSVTIRSRSNNFQIVVDGRTYNGNGRPIFDNNNTIHLDRIGRGRHRIEIFERSRGLFGSRMRLVSSKNFFVRNDDLRITVDRSGYINVDEVGYGNNRDRNYNDRDRNWNGNDRNRDWNDNDDRDWNGRSRY
jgi:hypothetical protein